MSNIPSPILVGEQLSLVVFVQDYLQLDFDGNTLTCYAWPMVVVNGITYTIKGVGYRDKLCQLITKKVCDVLVIDDESLQVIFDSYNKVVLSLQRDQETESFPELAYLKDVDSQWFIFD